MPSLYIYSPPSLFVFIHLGPILRGEPGFVGPALNISVPKRERPAFWLSSFPFCPITNEVSLFSVNRDNTYKLAIFIKSSLEVLVGFRKSSLVKKFLNQLDL